MDNFRIYSQATAGLLAAQAVPLLLSPGLVVWMISTAPKSLTSFESFLSRAFSFSLLLGAFLTLLFSGELSRLYADQDNSAATQPDATSPYSTPTTISTLLYHLSTSVLLYSYSYSGSLSSTLLLLLSIAHLSLGIGGLLLLMFKNEGKTSKRTGADKRTSGFPFKNREADKKHRR